MKKIDAKKSSKKNVTIGLKILLKKVYLLLQI